MTSILHEPTGVQKTWTQVLVPEMWASLAIIVIWLSVLLAAVWGPNITSTTPGGTDSSVPSAVALALFAFLGTWVVARYGFRKRTD